MITFNFTPTYTYADQQLPQEIIQKILTFSSEYITFFDEDRKIRVKYPIRKKVDWCFYNAHDNSFPSGFLSKVTRELTEEYTVEILSSVKKPEKHYDFEKRFLDFVRSKGKSLRDFQNEIPDIIQEYDSGVAEVGTGGGKTFIYGNLIARLGVKTLFVTIDLQSKQDTFFDKKDDSGFVRFFGAENVATIDQPDFDEFPIVVANIQNCWAKLKSNKQQFMRYLETVELLVVNECHHINEASIRYSLANTWFALALAVPAWYRFGATGTVNPEGSLGRALLTGAIGEVVYRKTTRELIEEGYATPIEAHIYKMDIVNNEHGKYAKAFEGLLDNEEFLKNICNLAVYYAIQNKKVIIFSEWVEKQALRLQDRLGDDWSAVIHGGIKTAQRDAILERFTKGDFPILISTVLSEDFNLPALDVGIIIGNKKNKKKVKQRTGRLARLFEGKATGIVVMIQTNDTKEALRVNPKTGQKSITRVDGLLATHSHEAIKILRDEGHQIVHKDFAEVEEALTAYFDTNNFES